MFILIKNDLGAEPQKWQDCLVANHQIISFFSLVSPKTNEENALWGAHSTSEMPIRKAFLCEALF